MAAAQQSDQGLITFPSLSLPPELRVHFYRLVLPTQDVSRKNEEWAGPVETAVGFMNLFCTNRQISNEARYEYYGFNNFTVSISPGHTAFLDSYEFADDFRPLRSKATPSLDFIKDWQLRLLVPPPLHTMAFDLRWIREGFVATSDELVRVSGLRTLKLSIPCLCDKPARQRTEKLRRALLHCMAPLKRVRFRNVRIICDSVSRTCGKLHVTCTEAGCIDFARSFSRFRDKLRGSTPLISTSPCQIKWRDRKARASPIQEALPTAVQSALYRTWWAYKETTFNKQWQVASSVIDEAIATGNRECLVVDPEASPLWETGEREDEILNATIRNPNTRFFPYREVGQGAWTSKDGGRTRRRGRRRGRKYRSSSAMSSKEDQEHFCVTENL